MSNSNARTRSDAVMRKSMADTMSDEHRRRWAGIHGYEYLTPGARRAAHDTVAGEIIHYMVTRCDAAAALHLAGGQLGLAHAAARLSVSFRASGTRLWERHNARRAAELEAAS